MNKFYKYFAFTSLLFLVPFVVFGAEFVFGKSTGVSKGVVVDNDLYSAGSTMVISGDVLGDAYIAGGNIIVDGFISEDLVGVGGNVTITGNIGDDIRMAAGTLIVRGSVGGDMIAGAGNIDVETSVEGDIRIAAGEVYLNGPVTGRARIDADKVTIGRNAVITGEVVYHASQEAIVENGADISGTLTYEPIGIKDSRDKLNEKARAFFAFFTITKFLMILAGALILGLMFKKYMVELVERVYDKTLVEIGRGFAFMILAPVISIILLVTVIGAPIGFLGLIGILGLMIFTCLMAPVVLGSILYKWLSKGKVKVDWKTILLGVTVFSLLSFIPIIGWIIQLIVAIATTGAIVYTKWQLVKNWR
ncbi:MAG: hypothetical protein COV29_02465 [Candidatus Yanofskybacteria bacterium CG10_big_fil_rev_8_21_14_0_10_36_16]|uniref:DUF8173 domain-containing protein n=1 Tax=Candidatus Yanofskybacteria bacterium CG10_big_fil_rev_8_21_14_0_10_36_16 TaxID=1975096 RepID=A0A2J0Q7S7_9BACT|nr:MAG: hypothetical protein COV29_02465 [Candidatus Yanofskybacteria bacterium CG10_big_fil_rev_8_21_14_0_10_36_16]